MDNARFVLIIFFFFLSVMLYQQWQMDYGPKPPAPAAQAGAAPATRPDVPASAADGTPTTAQASATAGDELVSRQRIKVQTDLVRLEIDTEGGDLRLLELLQYLASPGR